MSLERINIKKGYTIDNVCLIILPLNVGDWSKFKNDPNKNGNYGWTKEKLLWAVKQNLNI